MDPATASVVSSGITAGAGLIGSLVGGDSTAKANKLNRKTMYRQFRLNKAMRSTAVQDRMADLKAAGINPILAGRYDADSPASSVLASHNPAAGQAAMAQALGGTAAAAARLSAEVPNIMATTIKTLGETSYGQRAINELGGAEALAEMLANDPAALEKVTNIVESGDSWYNKAKAVLDLFLPEGDNDMVLQDPSPGLRVEVKKKFHKDNPYARRGAGEFYGRRAP